MTRVATLKPCNRKPVMSVIHESRMKTYKALSLKANCNILPYNCSRLLNVILLILIKQRSRISLHNCLPVTLQKINRSAVKVCGHLGQRWSLDGMLGCPRRVLLVTRSWLANIVSLMLPD